MKSKQAEQLIEKIDQAIKDTLSFQNISALEQSYLAKFLVVFICGIYEEIIETIINERASKCNDSEIVNYIRESVGKDFRNPDMGNIKNLLGRFNNSWKSEIGKLSHNSQTAIDNIVTYKNSLAHGVSVSITLQDIVKYYNDSMVVINKIDGILL